MGPLHTLKGNSGMMGFTGIKDYVHRLEDVFVRIGQGAVTLSRPLFDRLFAGASALRDAVEQACRQRGEVRSLQGERAVLDALLRETAPSPPIGENAGPSGRLIAPSAPTPTLPAAPPSAPARESLTSSTPSAEYISAHSSMVRVDFAQLDHLLNLVGELIIHRTKLHELGRELAEQKGGRETAELLAAVQQVAAVSTQLQETVMDIRMLPIRHVFERFPWLVRDLAR